ncbi:ABC transporter substrate-binding protein [Pontiella sp.]|uniref:ABC transporter substrate-binding protein n=1 Tax=Pontiella sp. TaxID=2837462 RepID=UPI003567B443
MMKVLSYIAALFLLAGCGKPAPSTGARLPERIITLAPNITETAYALGLGGKLVGATTFCNYPGEAQRLPRVGGFGQFNFEAIVALDPDLVILHEECKAEQDRLASLGIPYLETGSHTIADILATVRAIGKACGAESEAEQLAQRLNRRIAELKHTAQPRPRVLIAFGGSAGNGGQVHAFGRNCLHNELLEIAGGTNIVEGDRPYALLSKEAILRLNPDIVMVLAPELEDAQAEQDKWQSFSAIHAVKNQRVHILTDDYTCIPGPRFIQILEDFSEIIRQNNSNMKQPPQARIILSKIILSNKHA